MPSATRRKNEYGGFLPLELNVCEEYFAKYEPYLMRFNTVKSALYEIIKKENKKRIFIPYYYCPSTTEAIQKMGIEVIFYHVNRQLETENIPDDKDNIVLLVDYFGIKDAYIRRRAEDFYKAEVIIDRAHNFFAHPINKENIYNVYSAKKFYGIPDGAYLVCKRGNSQVQVLTDSNEYAGYLLKTYECGTNASYSAKKEADSYLNDNYNCMSKLALGLLKNVDYKKVRNIRQSNYEILRKAFIHINELKLPIECPAYLFPLLISAKGEEVKNALVEEKIYVPTLWSGEELCRSGNKYEINMMRNAIFLPIDQRYTEEDMDYLVDKIEELIE